LPSFIYNELFLRDIELSITKGISTDPLPTIYFDF